MRRIGGCGAARERSAPTDPPHSPRASASSRRWRSAAFADVYWHSGCPSNTCDSISGSCRTGCLPKTRSAPPCKLILLLGPCAGFDASAALGKVLCASLHAPIATQSYWFATKSAPCSRTRRILNPPSMADWMIQTAVAHAVPEKRSRISEAHLLKKYKALGSRWGRMCDLAAQLVTAADGFAVR